jgi:hypothetical protein
MNLFRIKQILFAFIVFLAISPGNTKNVTIIVHTDSVQEVTLLQGLLHGITYDSTASYPETVDKIKALKPRTWRLSAYYNDVYGFVVDEADLPNATGTKIIFNMADVLHMIYGMPFYVDTVDVNCPSRADCFPSYDSLETTWTFYVHQIMQRIVNTSAVIDYFDVFSEPNWSMQGITEQQKFELFKIAHDIIRQYVPAAKIVAPSVGDTYESQKGFLKGLMTFAVNNNLRLDVLSWHEFEVPDVVPAHVKDMRDFFKTLPEICDPVCPEIHINEYVPAVYHLISGFSVGWLYYFEQAGVNQANRACWDVGSWPNKYSTCWAGFNGLLLKDNKTPQPVYWVYRTYADMAGKRLLSVSTDQKTVALSDYNDTTGHLQILAGHFDSTGPADVEFVITPSPSNQESLKVQIKRIPSETGPAALLEPELISTDTLLVINDTLRVFLNEMQYGEAYIVSLKSELGPAVQRGSAWNKKKGLSLVALPNPFNSSFIINYEIYRLGRAKFTLFDIQGRIFRQLDVGPLNPGSYQISSREILHGRNTLPSGVYLLKLKTGDYELASRLFLYR